MEISTRSGDFHIRLSGDAADLEEIRPALREIANVASSPSDFFDSALPALKRHAIMLADVHDIGPEDQQRALAQRVRFIMDIGPKATALDCYPLLLATFQTAEAEEIQALISEPDDLALVSGYLHAILDDLDEARFAAYTELRNALGPFANVIVGIYDGH
jgi:hypothetical protein